MIDKQTLLERVDLLALADKDTQLKHVASTGGGEWAGACPFCGGQDRFRIQPNRRPHGLWMCRHCTGGKWQNAIDYVIRSDGCDFKQACAILAGGELPTTRERRPAPEVPAYAPTLGDWQAQALQAVEICERNLWDNSESPAMFYLKKRGLRYESIRYFRLGYSPGFKVGELWIPRGVVIPCIAGGEVWYLKIALLPGDRVRCEKSEKDSSHYCEARNPCPACGQVNKYRGVKGNRTAAIFNGFDLAGAEMALFCEGEFDAMIAQQEIGDVLPCVTLGAANNRLDLATWGAYLLGLRWILTTYDTDKAGQNGAAYLAELGGLACPLPEGVKDINDYYTAGGDLWAWLRTHLDRLGVLQALGALDPEPVDLAQLAPVALASLEAF